MRKFLFLISLDFYDVIHGDFLKPKRHWRLLAEITEIQKSLQITLMIRDKAGVQLPMFVSVDARPGDIWTRPDRVGHRVAMLYPHQQDFPGGVVGIRHEVESWVKVIPCPMVDFLALSDRVQAQSTRVYGKRACHGCGKREEALMECGRCNLCWYCDGVCQRVGWNQKGHREDCKILKDRDIQAMFALDWDIYESSLNFPLPHAATTS